MLQDTEMWHDPENFRPERHLDRNGKVFKNEAFNPFGIGRCHFHTKLYMYVLKSQRMLYFHISSVGKRICLGEPLARNTVFLFTAALAKTFEFKSLPNKPPPTLEPTIGLVLGPKPFQAVVFFPRVH